MYVIVIGNTNEYKNLNINLNIFVYDYNVIDVTQM